MFKSNFITILALSFLTVLFGIGVYLWSINSKVEVYSKHVQNINTLRLLNKDFNTFSLQKGSFVNYDEINTKIEAFEDTLESLETGMAYDEDGSTILSTLTLVEKEYQKKVTSLEHFKSYNSTISSSIQYLFDLKKRINLSKAIKKDDIRLIGSTLFMTTQLYAGLTHDIEQLKRHIDMIDSLARSSQNEYISYFVKHNRYILAQILEIQNEEKSLTIISIASKLDVVYKHIEEKYQFYMTAGKIILILFMISMVLMLSSILYLYKRSLKDKIELQAYKYAIENSDNSIVITNELYDITYVNEAFERDTGYTKEEVIGRNPRILKSGLMSQEYYDDMYKKLKNAEKWEGEFVNKRKDEALFYEKASINPIVVNNKITHYIAIKLDVTKYVEQEKKVTFLALHDQLTSLPNRMHFEKYFNEEIVAHNKQVALFYIDLDRFKTINDSLGHHVGDALLKVFAKRLRSAVEVGDFIARIGGDEFVMLVNITCRKDANIIATRVLNLLQTPIEVHGHSLNITTSIGLSFFPYDGDSLETLLKHADIAMYRAKNRGRNNFQRFTHELSQQIDERLEIEQALRTALYLGEFYVVYQPKYSLETRQVVGFEALVRWENETLGFIGPDKFIPIAEEIGLIHEIGLFVYKRACEDFKMFSELDPLLQSIAINISTVQFKEKNFIESIHELSKETGVKPSSIELEITESCIMDDVEKNVALLHLLRDQGYKIAIDDFGTGYSSFGYLNKLPIDTIKIDKSFVDNITTKESDKDIVHAIISLSKNLGFETVAEGIEDSQQEQMLLEDGCVLGQGYFFCRPQRAEEIKAFVVEKRSVLEVDEVV